MFILFLSNFLLFLLSLLYSSFVVSLRLLHFPLSLSYFSLSFFVSFVIVFFSLYNFLLFLFFEFLFVFIFSSFFSVFLFFLLSLALSHNQHLQWINNITGIRTDDTQHITKKWTTNPHRDARSGRAWWITAFWYEEKAWGCQKLTVRAWQTCGYSLEAAVWACDSLQRLHAGVKVGVWRRRR